MILYVDFHARRKLSNTDRADALTREADPLDTTDKAQRYRALELYAEALKLNPADANAWCNMGVCHYHGGMWIEAEACFIRALAIDDALPEPYMNLGHMHLHQGDVDDAIDAFAKAVMLSSSASEFHTDAETMLAEAHKIKEYPR